MRYSGVTPKCVIAKFGTKKVEILLTYSMVLSSAVLELFASESPIFVFAFLRYPFKLQDVKSWEDQSIPDLVQIGWLSAQIKFYAIFEWSLSSRD